MTENFCIIVNTVYSSSDIWEMFFTELENYFPNQKIYVFTDKENESLKKYNVILYDNKLDYRTQYLNSISQITEDFCINMNDDYILYDYVDKQKINIILDVLKTDLSISFIRVAKGYNYTEKKYNENNLYYLDVDKDFLFSQTVSLWKTKDLKKIHEMSPISGIGRKGNQPQLEVEADKICKKLKINGLYYFNEEKKRGSAHYDSSIFPYVASALVSGKWNLQEYKDELTPLIIKYKIDTNIRGIY